ncbi:MAG: hypothetical protein AVDCRST_MAG56-2999 [uncultured Cytophagales bacterium]|uniref:DoxX family protein n=1 Tax=uncultured Cytophagales bacterium TaxID=158755 RepID=A0A6J4J989_9SPHI|nr:MAG: hypothetical protein AVDCRST_MAG56-2999 [uncultured Cytophagales bacterium]
MPGKSCILSDFITRSPARRPTAGGYRCGAGRTFVPASRPDRHPPGGTRARTRKQTMQSDPKHNKLPGTVLTVGIAGVWLVNGLCCKLLMLVPRHQQIVSRILGETHAPVLTRAIGLLELLMVVWVLSGIWPRRCALTQLAVVSGMVLLECLLAPDLLLFGRANLIPAGFFLGIVYLNAFVIAPAPANG